MTQLRTLPVHVVIWVDASYSDEDRPELTVAVTMGVILERTADHVLLAGEIFDDFNFDKPSSESGVRHRTIIPMGMVKRIVKVGNVKLTEFPPPAPAMEGEVAGEANA